MDLLDAREVLLVEVGDQDDEVRELKGADGAEIGVAGARIDQHDLVAEVVGEGVGDLVKERQPHALLGLEEAGPIDGGEAAGIAAVELAGKQERQPAAGFREVRGQRERDEGVGEALVREDITGVEEFPQDVEGTDL